MRSSRDLKKSHKKQKAKREILSYFGFLLLATGFILVIGSPGAVDFGNIGLGQAFIQMLIGLFICRIGYGFVEKGGFDNED
jgi:hypothetical protein